MVRHPVDDFMPPRCPGQGTRGFPSGYLGLFRRLLAKFILLVTSFKSIYACANLNLCSGLV